MSGDLTEYEAQLPDDESKRMDILGIRPIADSVKMLTSSAIEGASAFLSRICLPAAEQFGLLLQDRVLWWRARNLAAITKKADELLKDSTKLQAHPRLVFQILDAGSWNDDELLQNLWAGLLASSCTETGNDDSNLLFINLISHISKLQARVIQYGCTTVTPQVLPNGLIQGGRLTVSWETLTDITGEADVERLDRELDNLRDIGLIGHQAGIDPYGKFSDIGPSSLALHFHVRCQGSRESPVDFFGLVVSDDNQNQSQGAK